MSESARPPTPEELDAELSDQDVTQVRVVTLGLLVGTLGLAGVAAAFAASQGRGHDQAPVGTDVLPLLSMVHVAVFVGCLLLRPVVRRLMLKAPLPPRRHFTPARAVIERAKGIRIVQLALLEGPALFGLTVIIVAASRDALAAQPLYGLNAASTVVFAVLALAHFPDRQRLFDDALDALE